MVTVVVPYAGKAHQMSRRLRAKLVAGISRGTGEQHDTLSTENQVAFDPTAIFLTACHHHSDNQAPKAAIAISQPSADQVTAYVLSSAASSDADGKIVAQRWDFGDGATSSEISPRHAYGASGSYVLNLTVTDDDGATASANRTIEITTPAVSAAVGSMALNVALPQVASIEVPAGSFTASTRIGLWTTATAETAADFDVTSQMFKTAQRAAREIRINTGSVQTANTLTVSANVPAELAQRLQSKDEPSVFVQVFQDGGEEVLDSFELVPATYDAATKTLRFELQPGMFTNRRTADETWEAVVIVGSFARPKLAHQTIARSVPCAPALPRCRLRPRSHRTMSERTRSP